MIDFLGPVKRVCLEMGCVDVVFDSNEDGFFVERIWPEKVIRSEFESLKDFKLKVVKYSCGRQGVDNFKICVTRSLDENKEIEK